MAFEAWKIKKKTKKEERQVAKDEKVADQLRDSNATRRDLARRSEAAKSDRSMGEWESRFLDREELERNIREARQNLFIQRDKLVRRVLNLSYEYKHILKQPDYPRKERELLRCSTGAKNAAYALAVVDDAISRLDDLHSEYEWHEIMTDLTRGYKAVNAISIGSDLMTRLAFFIQKTKMEIKGDVSVHAMERYYGKNIDELLSDQQVDQVASQLLVKDEVLDMEDSDELLDAMRRGTFYTVAPSELGAMAEEQSNEARARGSMPIYSEPITTFETADDIPRAMSLDDLPSTF